MRRAHLWRLLANVFEIMNIYSPQPANIHVFSLPFPFLHTPNQPQSQPHPQPTFHRIFPFFLFLSHLWPRFHGQIDRWNVVALYYDVVVDRLLCRMNIVDDVWTRLQLYFRGNFDDFLEHVLFCRGECGWRSRGMFQFKPKLALCMAAQATNPSAVDPLQHFGGF